MSSNQSIINLFSVSSVAYKHTFKILYYRFNKPSKLSLVINASKLTTSHSLLMYQNMTINCMLIFSFVGTIWTLERRHFPAIKFQVAVQIDLMLVTFLTDGALKRSRRNSCKCHTGIWKENMTTLVKYISIGVVFIDFVYCILLQVGSFYFYGSSIIIIQVKKVVTKFINTESIIQRCGKGPFLHLCMIFSETRSKLNPH